MGSYAYCSNKKCQRGLDKPTIEQVLRPHAHPYVCGACGTVNEHHEDFLDSIEELFRRVETLEEKLNPALS